MITCETVNSTTLYDETETLRDLRYRQVSIARKESIVTVLREDNRLVAVKRVTINHILGWRKDGTEFQAKRYTNNIAVTKRGDCWVMTHYTGHGKPQACERVFIENIDPEKEAKRFERIAYDLGANYGSVFDYFPMIKSYDLGSDPLSINLYHRKFSSAFRAENHRELTQKLFGKRRATPELISAVADSNMDHLYPAWLLRRNDTPVQWVVDLLTQQQGLGHRWPDQMKSDIVLNQLRQHVWDLPMESYDSIIHSTLNAESLYDVCTAPSPINGIEAKNYHTWATNLRLARKYLNIIMAERNLDEEPPGIGTELNTLIRNSHA